MEEVISNVTNILLDKFDTVYCDTCKYDDDSHCDDCHRKYMNWSLSEAEAKILAEKIYEEIIGTMM